MCRVTKNYVIALVEVRPISWVIMGVFVAMNYGRIAVIDPIFESDVCERYSADNLHHRHLSSSVSLMAGGGDDAADDSYGRHVCHEYMLRVTFVYSIMIVFYLFAVLIASEIYLHRMMDKILDQEETIEWLEEEEDRMRGSTIISPASLGCPPPLDRQTSIQSQNETPTLDSLPKYRKDTNERIDEDKFDNIALKDGQNLSEDGVELMAPVSNASGWNQTRASYAPLPQEQQEPLKTQEAEVTPASTVVSSMTVLPPSPPPHQLPAQERKLPRRMTQSYRMGSLRSDHGGSIPHQQHQAESADEDSVTAAATKLAAAARRRSHMTRMNSIRSEQDRQEILSAGAAAAAESSNNGASTLNAVAGSNWTSRIGPRMGSIRSEDSHYSQTNSVQQHHSSLNSIHIEKAPYNRRYLYLPALERIMHAEFETHAHNAKRLSLVEEHHHNNNNNHHHHNGTDHVQNMNDRGSFFFSQDDSGRETISGAEEGWESPRALTKRSGFHSHYNLISPRDRSGSHAATNANGGTPDLRSNFQIMKDLRDEMLHLREPPAAAASSAAAIVHGDRAEAVEDGEEDVETGPASKKKPEGKESRFRNRTFSLQFLDPSHFLHNGEKADQDKEKVTQEETADASPKQPNHQSATVRSFRQRMIRAKERSQRMIYRVASSTASSLMGHHLGMSTAQLSPDEDIATMQRDFSRIFLFDNAELYYHSVELALLIQCVYIAFWATNLALIASESYFPVLWNIALVFWMPINFYMLKHIIFTSALLKSIVTLDKHVADQICEDAVDNRNVTQRLRKVIRGALRSMELPKEEWNEYTKEQFFLFVGNSQGASSANNNSNISNSNINASASKRGLTKSKLKLFLHSLHIFLTDQSVDRIFSVIDFDRDGYVLWEDMSPIAFPDLQRKKVRVKRNSGLDNRIRASLSFDISDDASKQRKMKRAPAASNSSQHWEEEEEEEEQKGDGEKHRYLREKFDERTNENTMANAKARAAAMAAGINVDSSSSTADGNAAAAAARDTAPATDASTSTLTPTSGSLKVKKPRENRRTVSFDERNSFAVQSSDDIAAMVAKSQQEGYSLEDNSYDNIDYYNDDDGDNDIREEAPLEGSEDSFTEDELEDEEMYSQLRGYSSFSGRVRGDDNDDDDDDDNDNYEVMVSADDLPEEDTKNEDGDGDPSRAQHYYDV